MRKIFLSKVLRILKSKKILEEELKVKIEIKGREAEISGTPEQEYLAEQVILAVDFGFEISVALMIKQEDLLFEILNIKDYTSRSDLERIRGRIIGTKGKTKKTLISLSECFIEVKNNQIGIIGYPENVKNVSQALISLIKGTKQSNVYAYLEHHRVEPVVDLGLKKGEDYSDELDE